MRPVKAVHAEIQWKDSMPVFAKESFLKAVGDEYGWIAGVDSAGNQLCVLPYVVTRERGINLGRFRVETVPLVADLELEEEKEFLRSSLALLKSRGVDIIIPATTNAVFRVYPEGADAAPYGSYFVDLTVEEEALWKNIERITRQNIKSAQKNGVVVHDGAQSMDASYELIKETFGRSRLPFMKRESFYRYVDGLGENGKLLVAERGDELQSCVVFASSKYCTYAVYGGNREDQVPGANKLLHWEAMRQFRESGALRYDFVGARINPEKGSKADAINSFKRRLGGKLRQGYIWKSALKPLRSFAYTAGVRLLRGGDIVDRERPKMKSILAEGKVGT
jgi:hypothetical protein